MKATVEPLEGNKVKVLVEVDASEFEKAIDVAFRKIAREVRIPGFRPGKAPRRVLEARLGADVGRQQALQDSVPEYYAQAVRDHDVDVIAAPELEVTAGEDEGDLAFEAVVEVRPVIQVPGYGSLRVTIDSPEPSEEDLDAQIDRLRNQFAELEAVERPAVEGDFVTIDVSAVDEEGEAIPQLTAEDYLYEVGSEGILPGIDEQIVGAEAGQTLTFDVEDPRDDEAELSFTLVVKEIKEKVLPEADDEFADEASEFETIDGLRADLRTRMTSVRKVQAQMALREATGNALAELVEDEVPEALVNSEMQNRLNDLAMRLQAQGLDLDTWVAMSGKSPDEVVSELREAAEVACKVDLALRAVAEAEALECTDEDLDDEFAAVAERVGMKVAEVRKQFERADQVPAVRSDIRKRKAFDWLLERVEIVDQDGKAIDRADLELETPGGDDADGDGEDEGAGTDTVSGPAGESEAGDDGNENEDGE